METQIGIFGAGLLLFLGFMMGYGVGVFRESLWHSKHYLGVKDFYHDMYRNMEEIIRELENQLTKQEEKKL